MDQTSKYKLSTDRQTGEKIVIVRHPDGSTRVIRPGECLYKAAVRFAEKSANDKS